MTKNIDKILITYKQEKYNSVGITNAKLAAVALYHLEENEIDKTFENVVVALQKLFPGKFSLITYPDIPDTIRVDNTLRLDAGKGHAEYLTGNRPKGYRLTSKGRFAAEETIQLLQSSNTKQKKQTLDYKRQNRYVRIVSAITKSDCFEKYTTKQLSEITNFDVRRLVQCTLQTPEEKVLANFDTVMDMTIALSKIKEYEKITNGVLELLNYIQDHWRELKND